MKEKQLQDKLEIQQETIKIHKEQSKKLNPRFPSLSKSNSINIDFEENRSLTSRRKPIDNNLANMLSYSARGKRNSMA